MPNIKKMILYGCYMFSPGLGLFSQINPVGDNNWIYISALSDEFNYSSRTGLYPKWIVANDFDHYGELEVYRDRDPNVYFLNSDTLVLSIRKEPYSCSPPGCQRGIYEYTSGMIIARTTYEYGYFEIKAKLPKGHGFWPAFWLSSGHPNPNGWSNDLCILEPYGAIMGNPITYSTNISSSNSSNCTPYTYPLEIQAIPDNNNYTDPYVYTIKYFPIPDLSSDYHIYGCEWLPGRVIWYFDYNVVRIVNNSMADVSPNTIDKDCPGDVVPSHPMSLFFNFAIDPYVNESTLFPACFKIDWFRYYHLKKDNINSDLQILTSSQLSSYNLGVRKNITIGNSSSNINLTSAQKMTLRATGDFLIQGEFSIPYGAEFGLIPIPSF